MSVFQATISVRTEGQGFSDLGRVVAGVVVESGIQTGLCTIFVRHTSASLVIQENADPAVLRDLAKWMEKLVPEGRHWDSTLTVGRRNWGPSGMPVRVTSRG